MTPAPPALARRVGALAFVVVLVGCGGELGLRAEHRLASLTGHAPVSTNHVPGVGELDFFLDPDDEGMTPFFMKGGPWEPNESHWFARSVGPGDTVVDVGAHIGYYTVLAGRLVGPEGRVFAFEPDPDNFALLERNVRLNGLRNVVLEQKAVADEPGTVRLFRRERHFGDHRIYQPAGEQRRAIDVEAVSLDDYFRGREAELDFVKIDTQGAEGAIVKGMQAVLASSDGLRIAIEFSPHHLRSFGSEPRELVRDLAGAGFAFYDLFMGGEPRDLVARERDWLLAYDPRPPFFTNLYLTKRPGELPDGGRVGGR